MSISIDDLKVGTVVTLKKDFDYDRIYARHPSENEKYVIEEVDYNSHWGLSDLHGCINFKYIRSRYPVECIESIVGKENNTSKKKWKLDEVPTNTYIHNFPSVEKLNELIDFFNKKAQTNRSRYKKFPSEDPTLYISNTGYIDVFHKSMEEADLEDYFENAKDQARADIRKGIKAVRELNSEVRSMENDPKEFSVGNLADFKLQIKVEQEKIDKMKEIFLEYFGEEFSK